MRIFKQYINLLDIFVIGAFGAIILLIGLCLWGTVFGIYIPTERDGEHTGYITAVQSDFWGNYNVFFKTELESSQEDVYCIRKEDPMLVEKSRGYQRNRELVTLSYTGYFFQKLTDCSSQIIEGIK